MPAQLKKLQLISMLGIGIVAISSASIFIKLCEAPSLVIASYRMLVASVIYWGVAAIKKQSIWSAFTASQRKVAFISGVFLTIHFMTWITSLSFTSVASSVVLVQSAPVFVVAGSFLLLGEKPTWQMLMGVLITLTGVIVISVHDFSLSQQSLQGNLLAVGGAIGAAGYILAGRKLRANINVLGYVTFVYSVAALLLLIISIFLNYSFFKYNLETYLLLLAIGLIPQVIGHTTFNWALKFFSATTISIVILGEPIGASLLAWLVLAEPISNTKIAGGLVIILGVVSVIVAESRMYFKMSARHKTTPTN